ncbi:MAG: hypothetical protein OHK93_004811 [Ramalina farinacea]|uniref:FAD dependent oxidoreductase domain-containing protein n=1 Tax=Ramalina farinacea TaxID=258253 RepID=A0AA43QVF4_9LECA|nr:hypothetical protein [Ramalina farinacea]
MEALMAEVLHLCRARNQKAGPNGPGGVTFHRASAASLLTSPTSPTNDGSVHLLGVTTTSALPLHADVIILATGAWTPSLLDLRGRAKATAQVLAYLPLTDEEARMLAGMKVLLNLGTGMFAIPPIRNGEGVWELKLARHGYGYENVVEVELGAAVVETGLPLSQKGGGGKVRVQQSLPSQHFTPIPQEAEMACRGFLKQMFPPSSSMLGQLADRPFASTRLCWYTDTPKADFLVDFHPRFRSPVGKERGGDSVSRNLLIATGGSGHAFKFLPVIGEKIVARLEGRLEPELAGLWEWRRDRVDGDWGEVDGSRGGVKGMRLEDEWAKGRKRGSRL